MLYQTYQAHADSMGPLRSLARNSLPALNLAIAGPSKRAGVRELAAACEVFALAALTHRRPEFRINRALVGEPEIAVEEEIAHQTAFWTLPHFKKDMPDRDPRVLIVAPMSGHFATLLRETARIVLADHDVYITDWHNAREVPVMAGRFGLDEYTEHIIDFLGAMGPGASLMAICQPCVAALAAVSIMSEDNHPATPAAMVLMAGPIDCRIAPTAVNKLATDKPVEWFEKNLIATVPLRYGCAMRKVYPGFLQLMAFLSMNLERHLNAFRGLYDDILNNEMEKGAGHAQFLRRVFRGSRSPRRVQSRDRSARVPGIRAATGQAQVAGSHRESGRHSAHGSAHD